MAENNAKIIIIGDANVGKTCFIRRYVENKFFEVYSATIGVEFAMKQVKWDEQTIFTIRFWDLAGQERFAKLSRVYYRDSNAAVVVFDVTSRQSFENAAKWKQEIDSLVKYPHSNDEIALPCVLAANKSDLEAAVSQEEIEAFSVQYGFDHWFYTSSKNNLNLDNTVKFLLKKIIDINKTISPPAPSASIVKVRGNASSSAAPAESGGCC